MLDRLVEKTVPFQSPMQKLKLNTFSSMAAKCSVPCGKKKVVQVTAERNVFGQLLVISQKHNILLEKIFQYPLGPVPRALATADGCLTKTNKSVLLHILEKETEHHESSPLDNSVYVVDGNAIPQSVSSPETFSVCSQFCSQTLHTRYLECFRKHRLFTLLLTGTGM